MCFLNLEKVMEWRINGLRFATKESLEEIHRVLGPGAGFGMIWNIEDCILNLS